MKKIILTSVVMLLFAVNVAAHNKTIFFIEIDNKNDIHAGQLFQVQYLSDRPMQYIDIPEWKDNIEVLNTRPARISRSSYVNGKKQNINLNGVTYTLRVEKAGTITIPATSAIIAGERYSCQAEKIKIHAPKKIKDIHCSFATKPEEITERKRFTIELICDYKPDRQPAINAEGLRVISTSTSTSINKGKKEYKYIYNLIALRKGEYQITPRNLTFNGTPYKMEPFTIKVFTKRNFQMM